jgi:hypothetical protein
MQQLLKQGKAGSLNHTRADGKEGEFYRAEKFFLTVRHGKNILSDGITSHCTIKQKIRKLFFPAVPAPILPKKV